MPSGLSYKGADICAAGDVTPAAILGRGPLPLHLEYGDESVQGLSHALNLVIADDHANDSELHDGVGQRFQPADVSGVDR